MAGSRWGVWLAVVTAAVLRTSRNTYGLLLVNRSRPPYRRRQLQVSFARGRSSTLQLVAESRKTPLHSLDLQLLHAKVKHVRLHNKRGTSRLRDESDRSRTARDATRVAS